MNSQNNIEIHFAIYFETKNKKNRIVISYFY